MAKVKDSPQIADDIIKMMELALQDSPSLAPAPTKETAPPNWRSTPRSPRGEGKSRVARFVAAHPGCLVKDIAEEIDLCPTQIFKYLQQLERDGRVEHTGEKRTGFRYSTKHNDVIVESENNIQYTNQNVAVARGDF